MVFGWKCDTTGEVGASMLANGRNVGQSGRRRTGILIICVYDVWISVCIYTNMCTYNIHTYIYILQIDLGVSTHGEGVCKSNDVSDEWCVGWWREGYLSRDPVDWPFMSFSVRQLWYGGMRGDLVGKNSFDSYHLHILTLLPVDL